MATKKKSDSNKLNGSVDVLANAFRTIIKEAAESAIEPVLDEMGKMEQRLNQKIDDTNKTINDNMQSQFAALEQRLNEQLSGQKGD